MKKIKYLILVLIISLFVTFSYSYANREKIREYKNDDIKISYDNTWKAKKQKTGVILTHRKTDSKLNIQVKKLERNLIDTKLSLIINDIISGIEEQNSDYVLINQENNVYGNYESYSYLYEKEDTQVLVNVYKSNEKLVIVYYEALSEYYDIVIDSVDNILDSLEIITGENVFN